MRMLLSEFTMDVPIVNRCLGIAMVSRQNSHAGRSKAAFRGCSGGARRPWHLLQEL